VHPLPGIADGFTINSSITLPVGVEAYGAYALRAWLTPGISDQSRRFARWSAVGSLGLGMAGQVIYHLLSAAHAKAAPWPVVTLVSCLPVVALALGTALAHLIQEPVEVDVPVEDVPAEAPIPTPETSSGTVSDAAPASAPTEGISPAPGSTPVTVAESAPRKRPQERSPRRSPARARKRPAPVTGAQAEAAYADLLSAGELPSLRAIRRELRVGAPRARSFTTIYSTSWTISRQWQRKRRHEHQAERPASTCTTGSEEGDLLTSP
jgi:hypothetical protein